MNEATVARLLAEQRREYGARAPEYDDLWFRRADYALDTRDPSSVVRGRAGARGGAGSLRAARRRPRARRRDWNLDPSPPRYADRVTDIDAVAEGSS
jgi:hypothetical protein